MKRVQLFSHQEEGVERVYKGLVFNKIDGVHTHAFLLHDEMGLGKTIQAYEVAQRLELTSPILVVAPSSCMCVWKDQKPEGYSIIEFDKKFSKAESPQTIVLTSYTIICNAYKYYLGEKLYQGALTTEELERYCELNGRSTVHMLGLPEDHKRRELLRMATSIAGLLEQKTSTPRPDLIALLSRRWGLLIMDEVHRIRNSQSIQTRAVGFIQACYRLGLSGTPVMNSGSDMLNIWKYGLGLFHLRWNEITSNPNGAYVVSIIGLTCFGRSKEDVQGLPLPKRNKDEEEVILGWDDDSLHKEAYIAIKQASLKDFYLLQQTQEEVTRRQLRMSFMDKLQKLRQACIYAPRSYTQQVWNRATHRSFPRWIREGVFSILLSLKTLPERFRLAVICQWVGETSRAPIIPTPKMIYVYRMLLAHPSSSKMLVYSSYKSFLQDVMEPWLDSLGIPCLLFCGASRKEQGRILKDFQNEPDIRVLLVVKTAGSEGLNLSCANLCVIMDPHFNAALDEQAAQRIDRIGQEKEVIVRKLYMEGSIDEALRIMQREKLEASESWTSTTKGMKSLKVQGLFLEERDTVGKPPIETKKEVSPPPPPPAFGIYAYEERPFVYKQRPALDSTK